MEIAHTINGSLSCFPLILLNLLKRKKKWVLIIPLSRQKEMVHQKLRNSKDGAFSF
jgi:uncharacterized LabA/DUF88 family protein